MIKAQISGPFLVMDLVDLAAISPDIVAASSEIAASLRADKEAKQEDPAGQVEDLSQELAMPIDIVQDQAIPVEITREEKPESWFDKLLTDSSRANLVISVVNALLHFVASVTSFDSVRQGPVMVWFNKQADRAALLCTKYFAPFCSYGLGFVDSVRKGRLVQALIKLLPPGLLPFVGDANIDTVYGSSTGLNCPYNMIEERIKFKSAHSEDFKAYAEKANETALGNAALILQELKSMFKDFMEGKLSTEYNLYMINCPLILLGSIPILIFGRNDRDTLLAKSMGLIRSVGGIIGDIGYGIFGKESYKKLVGGFCGLAAVADVAKRWTKSELLARLLIHLGAALNVSAYAVWNAFDSSDKDSAEYSKAAEIKGFKDGYRLQQMKSTLQAT